MREFLVIGALLIGAYFWSGREISRPAGVLVAEEPVQRQVYTSLFHEKHGLGSDVGQRGLEADQHLPRRALL